MASPDTAPRDAEFTAGHTAVRTAAGLIDRSDFGVIEVTGRLGHSTPTERGRDAQRRNELQDLGYAMYEYTYGDVTRRRDYVVTTLRERLAAVRSPVSPVEEQEHGP